MDTKRYTARLVVHRKDDIGKAVVIKLCKVHREGDMLLSSLLVRNRMAANV